MKASASITIMGVAANLRRKYQYAEPVEELQIFSVEFLDPR